MILRICKSILLFFNRLLEVPKQKTDRIEIAILPEIETFPDISSPTHIGYGQDYIITNQRI